MPVSALVEVMTTVPALSKKIAQIVALKEAARMGVPFCEVCAEAEMKK
jgi:hypothetical protein